MHISMQKLALRLLSRFSRKTFIRSAWKNLNSLSEHDELSDALDTLISMSHEENEFIELITVIVDVLSEAPMASAFLCHIIDSAALPSKETSHKITTRLLQKLRPGICGIYRTKPKKRTRVNAAIIWSVLAEKLAGEISLSLFSDNVCNTLLDYLQHDTDPSVRLFSLIALEKFGITGQNKEKIVSSGKDIHKILLALAKELQLVESPTDDVNRRRQLKFCVEWALKNTFESLESEKGDSCDSSDSSVSSNINVMLNPMDATAHWKISPHGLEIRNDNSTFESIRATTSVSSGRWFYEVLLLTNGIMQIGYATKRCMFGPEEGTGVGDDQHGFAFDGCRNVLWANGVSMPYGGTESWKPGDVIGVYMDVGLGVVRFSLNGKDLGDSPLNPEQFRKLAEHGLHPALSFTSYQQAVVNFGAENFSYPPPPTYQPLNNHGQLSFELRDSIKKRVWRASRYRPMSVGSCWKQPFLEAEEDFDAQCSICFAMPPSIRLNPCNHDGFCVDCAKMMHSCPLCRTPISFRKPSNSKSASFPSTPTKLSISSTSASSSLSSPSTAIVLPPTPPHSRPASSITSWDPDLLRGLEP